MKTGILLIGLFISGICSAELWTFQDGYEMADLYCVPNGLSLGQEHASYWKDQGQVNYANGIKERLGVCSLLGAFTPPSSNSSLNKAICDQLGNGQDFPSVYNFVQCGEQSDDSDFGNP